MLRPGTRTLGGLAISLAVAALIATTWVFTARSIEQQRIEISDRVTARVTNQAVTFSEQIGRQILTLDQTLRILARAWERDPAGFDLGSWQSQLVAPAGLSRDIMLIDATGIVRQSTLVSAVGQSVADRDDFRFLTTHPESWTRLYLGPTTLDGFVRTWHMNVARVLRQPDGSFAGLVAMDYRISALTEVFSQANVGAGGFVALVGLTDGLVRAANGLQTVDPAASLDDTRMMAAIRSAPAGVWVGPSAFDATPRIHAYDDIGGQDLAVVVGLDERAAMRPALEWRDQARMFAAFITVLLLANVAISVMSARRGARREAVLAEERTVLAAANAQLEVARAHAAAKTEQLEVTLRGMTEGVAMFDAHLCLMEWNARFPELVGVPAQMLRVGLPMEEILRVQARGGQFGAVDVEAEVTRRVSALRTGRFGITERRTPEGRTLELRRNRLPDGGFVTLYTDITSHKQAEAALREAHAAAETANAAKTRFVAIVSHEIRTPLNGLLNTLRLMAEGDLPPSQRHLLDLASQSGGALSSLINDILEMSQAETGQLTLRPSRFSLRTLLESALDVFRAPAESRGLHLRLEIAKDIPADLTMDPGRLRQVLLNLLSNAVKFANPGDVALVATMSRGALDASPVLRVDVRDAGPVIAEADRSRLFQPFSRLERGEADSTVGSGLGLSICRHLADRMGGEVGCEAWRDAHGVEGNQFWVAVPVEIPPPVATDAAATSAPPGLEATADPLSETTLLRRLPRTRILLVEDVRANQLVTATMLRRDGHMVDVAGTGEKAIELARRNPYDIILMDIFMPGMGGQEAARQLRALPVPAAATPILALTANVSPRDEAVFREAGMDGLLAKPVSLPDLLNAIRIHVWWPNRAPASDGDAVAEPEATEPASPSPLAMARIEELRSNLAPEVFTRLIEECLVDLDHRLPALRRALRAGVPGAIVAQSHAMVGIAAGYGMARLEEVLRGIMDAARQNRREALDPETIADVEVAVAEASSALRAQVHKEVA